MCCLSHRIFWINLILGLASPNIVFYAIAILYHMTILTTPKFPVLFMNDYVKLQCSSPVPVYASCSTKNSSWELNLVAVLLSSYEIVPCLYLVTFSMCNDCMPAFILSFLKCLSYFKYRCECDASWLLITMIFGRHKIVIVEGNYLLLEEDVWTEIRDLLDEKWWVCRLCNYNSH